MADPNEPDTRRLQQINALLVQALALPPHERDAWLAALPATAQPLAPSLRALLARAAVETDDFMRDDFMRQPVDMSLAALDAESVAADHSGDRVGPYRLIRELGAGGMATVWLAERADGALQRQVALKLPHAGRALGLARRMARERDILATLEHPHIARLYDAGESDLGRPYLAMEWVDGRPIDGFCGDQASTVEQRLRLFLQVADALAYAHARLVVHRDLKPSNILVTSAGEVRLLDFGVAKLLADGTTHDTQLTQLVGRAFTPDYASPEQIRGEPLTVSSDVYSLAVVLYELLTGQRPYKLERRTAAALEQAITEADVPLASARAADDRTLQRALRGDIDTVLAKALKKSPGERYASMEAFAADIRRHLDNEPVLARPDSLAYRTARLMRRHRGAVAAGALVAAAIAVGLAGTLTQAQRAERLAQQAQQERDAALKDLKFAEAAESFMRLVLGEASGKPFTTAELLDRADEVVDAQYADDAALRARLQMVVADLFGEQRDFKRALAVLERAQASAQASGDAALLPQVLCRQAGMQGTAGDPERATRVFTEVLSRLAEASDRATLALCHMHRSTMHARLGRPQAAIDDATQALRYFGTPRPAQVSAVGTLRTLIANAHVDLGHVALAIELLEKQIQEAEAMGQGKASIATALANNLGVVLGRAGQPERAARAYQRGIAVANAAGASSDHALTISYARLLVELGRADEALPLLEQATAASERAGDALFHAMGRVGLASAHCDLRDWSRCDSTLQDARDALRPTVPPERAIWGTVELIGARARLARGEPEQARRQLREALALYDKAADYNVGRARALPLLARAEVLAGDLVAAQEAAAQGVVAARNVSPGFAHNEWLGSALLAQAIVRRAQGDADAAHTQLEEALQQLQNSAGNDAPSTREARALLGGE